MLLITAFYTIINKKRHLNMYLKSSHTTGTVCRSFALCPCYQVSQTVRQISTLNHRIPRKQYFVRNVEVSGYCGCSYCFFWLYLVSLHSLNRIFEQLFEVTGFAKAGCPLIQWIVFLKKKMQVVGVVLYIY